MVWLWWCGIRMQAEALVLSMGSVPLDTPQGEYKYVPSYFALTVVCLLVDMSLNCQSKQGFIQFSTTFIYLAIFV